MNRLENMETFVRVVEAGSISAAAERLGVAKSAVSRRLKELETHLGVELFHRTTRRMNLTDTGRGFYQHCLRLLDDVLEAELAASQAHATLAGRLKVAMPSSFGLMHMSSAINDFLLANPAIEFDLDFNDREVDLIQEGFDLAIRIGHLPDSSLIARRLAPIRLILCASPAYLDEQGTPRKPQELAAHDCLVYSLSPDPEHWQLPDGNGNVHRIKIHPRLRASTGEFLKDAAVAGQGIILLPSFIAYREIEQGSLQPILCDYQPAQLDAYVIYPPTRHLSQRVRAFVDFLADRFAGLPYWDRCLQP